LIDRARDVFWRIAVAVIDMREARVAASASSLWLLPTVLVKRYEPAASRVTESSYAR